ncbi:MAG: hypothetical protein KGO96_10450 [Elusimicrobia bacterium]|nr:hypothetical protein [Patescibacteria group bacterium]MDE2426312.1 hypothetical protein [Elusimicrobiota bacterium]
MSDKDEYYRTIGRCLSARGIHPCRLLTNWHNIEAAIERRRKSGVSAYAVVAELWPEPVPSNLIAEFAKALVVLAGDQ